MCHLRAQRHSCGHIVSRPVSVCRFTYASPVSAERPLCHASPNIVVNVDNSCRNCEYNVFCQRWEIRLSDARAKQSAARMLLKEVLQEEDEMATGDWWPQAGDDEEGSPEQVRGRPISRSHSSFNISSPTDEIFGWGGMNNGFSDSAAVRQERQRADREVENLWTEYQHQQWTAWRYFITGPTLDSESSHRRSFRRRRTQCRFSGPSRLSSVTSIDDLPDPVPEVSNPYDDDYARNEVSSPMSEMSLASNESEGSDQGSISSAAMARSIRSDVSSDWKQWSWPKSPSALDLTSSPISDHLNLDTSGRVSPPSPTCQSPRGSTGAEWDDDEDSPFSSGSGRGSRPGKYRPRAATDDSGIVMMESGAVPSEKLALDVDDDWLPAWG